MSRRVTENRNPGGSSVYPLVPPGSRVIFRMPHQELALFDRFLVVGSSLFIVGSVAWVPALCAWAWRKWRSIPASNKRRRAIYAAVALSAFALLSWGPHRSVKVGNWLQVRKWRLWSAWLKFIAMEVIADQVVSPSGEGRQDLVDLRNERAILAFVPHGVFPYALAFGCFPDAAKQAFGIFRPVVATATRFFPFVRDLLVYSERVDASKQAVDQALARGDRLGLVPGGIEEMFLGHPNNPKTQPNTEYAIVRKGFLRLAQKHAVPVVPIYCFGASKQLHTLYLPLLERISVMIRASLVIFFGKFGLPIPFRQRLLYVMGNPIQPPSNNAGESATAVEEMYQQFCDELVRLFERHKEHYGWGHKKLKLLSR